VHVQHLAVARQHRLRAEASGNGRHASARDTHAKMGRSGCAAARCVAARGRAPTARARGAAAAARRAAALSWALPALRFAAKAPAQRRQCARKGAPGGARRWALPAPRRRPEALRRERGRAASGERSVTRGARRREGKRRADATRRSARTRPAARTGSSSGRQREVKSRGRGAPGRVCACSELAFLSAPRLLSLSARPAAASSVPFALQRRPSPQLEHIRRVCPCRHPCPVWLVCTSAAPRACRLPL